MMDGDDQGVGTRNEKRVESRAMDSLLHGAATKRRAEMEAVIYGLMKRTIEGIDDVKSKTRLKSWSRSISISRDTSCGFHRRGMYYRLGHYMHISTAVSTALTVHCPLDLPSKCHCMAKNLQWVPSCPASQFFTASFLHCVVPTIHKPSGRIYTLEAPLMQASHPTRMSIRCQLGLRRR